MKNIHILPTDKPSRLSILNSGKLDFGPEIMSSSNSKPQHIYITSNEEIKEGDWYYYFGHIINYECDEHTLTPNCKKIILTTDQDLIKDGVQSIDDEFLQWFVKNPSCEEVEVNSIETNPDYKSNWENRFTYEIIIPKEEPKQETLEEAAENYSLELLESKTIYPHEKTWIKSMFVHIARLQRERMYSEEDLKRAYFAGVESTGEGWNGEYAGGNDPIIEEVFKEGFENWFKQFKKKMRPKEKQQEKIMKQETLEEVAEIGEFAEKKYLERLNNFQKVDFKDGVFEGAKWQQEKMYSEEEVQVKLYECLGHFAQKHNIIINGSEIDQWFEQFKKKDK